MFNRFMLWWMNTRFYAPVFCNSCLRIATVRTDEFYMCKKHTEKWILEVTI